METIRTLCMLSLLIGIFLSCNEKSNLDAVCKPRICTEEYRSVTVRFKDHTGDFILVDDYKVTHRASGKDLKRDSALMVPNEKYYLVLADGDKDHYKEEGEEFIVSATHPLNKQKAEAIFKIAGGKCACHIEKISGPNEIIF